MEKTASLRKSGLRNLRNKKFPLCNLTIVFSTVSPLSTVKKTFALTKISYGQTPALFSANRHGYRRQKLSESDQFHGLGQ